MIDWFIMFKYNNSFRNLFINNIYINIWKEKYYYFIFSESNIVYDV